MRKEEKKGTKEIRQMARLRIAKIVDDVTAGALRSHSSLATNNQSAK